MKISKLYSIVEYEEYGDEKYINLCKLDYMLKKGFEIEMEECLITPYYIQDGRRMELYHYEFYCSKEVDFEEHVLRLTGRKTLDEIPEKIVNLRKKCFSNCYNQEKLCNYLYFLFEDASLRDEVETVFGKFERKNIFIVIY